MATTTEAKHIYEFEEGRADMRDLLGGKGAGLSEMVNMGLPVPPGFTITTATCREYYERGKQVPDGFWDEARQYLSTLEEKAGKRLGNPADPLLVSVRSGAKFSMPGMMDTILNLGLNDETAAGLARLTGDERFAYDAYRRFLQMFSKVVLGVDADLFEHAIERAKQLSGARTDADLSPQALKSLVGEFKEITFRDAGRSVPQDAWEQLKAATLAVFESWNNSRAITYRNFNRIPHDLGTAVNIVAMVFGNMGPDSGSGVAFTRDPATGERVLYGEYLANAQGEDVVAGIRTPTKIAQLQQENPELYNRLADIAQRLESHYRDAQDIEFTVERNKLYILQTRSAKRTGPASVRIAVELSNEGVISHEEAVQRVNPAEIVQLLLPRFVGAAKDAALKEGRRIGSGLAASPGAAGGKVVFDANRAVEMANRGETVILVRPETNPDDVHGILKAVGVLTSRGGITSHAAVVTRGLGKPCIVGAGDIRVDLANRRLTAGDHTINEGDLIAIDGATGEVFAGQVETVAQKLTDSPELLTLLSWADAVRRLEVWANADYPTDAAAAIAHGAEGIGLCRTEHMFFQTDRLPHVQAMLVAAPEAAKLADVDPVTRDASPEWQQYTKALAKLEEFQTSDFTGILETMAGKPVIIRLLDAPLHEFLPSHDELLVEVTKLEMSNASYEIGGVDTPPTPHYGGSAPGTPAATLAGKQEELRRVERLREANPMLGHRGCRVGITFSGLYEMQARAIVNAAVSLKQRGIDAKPEIMIPLISHANELKVLRDRLVPLAEETIREAGVDLHVPFGTMIETPRAALTAGEVAETAEFFSFGSNDLTQMSFAYSRDDAEEKFLAEYIERGILPVNPFAELDRAGVGRLVKMATTEGRGTRPDLSVGICGEHGGDPSSVFFCHEAGLNYVSCSPFRVPVARLAAAQAALGSKEKDV
jgi:pyruvate,orthophosphate dikinase